MTQSSARAGRKSASTLRAEHKEGMRRALLAAAVDLIVEDGPDALTVKRLADEFGSSVGMIYRLFDSKEALVAAIRAVRFTRLAELAAEAAGAGSPASSAAPDELALGSVVRAGRFWIDACRRMPGEVDALRQALADPEVDPADRQAAAGAALQPLVEALGAAREAGGLGTGDDRSRASTVLLVLAAGTPTMDLGGDPYPSQALGERLLVTLLEGWGADPTTLRSAAASSR